MARQRKKREEEAAPGCPLWMLTYGDMITQLMCFFVLLVSFSAIQEEKLRAALASVKQALGGNVSQRTVPGHAPMTTRPEIQSNPGEGGEKEASVDTFESIRGPDVRVETVKEGTKITIGGKILFDEGKAELKPEAKEKLLQIASLIRGYKNKINVIGHTSPVPLPAGSPYKDHMELSAARARAIRDFLVEQGGVRPERVWIIGASTYDNVASNLYEEGRAQNNRGEIIVTTEYVPTGG